MVSRANRVDDEFQGLSSSEEVQITPGVDFEGYTERAAFEPHSWDDEMAEIISVSAEGVGDFAHVAGSAKVFTRITGTKCVWMVKVTGADGTNHDIVFDDTLVELPVSEVVEPTLDKFLPLDSGEYNLKIRMQLVPPSLAGVDLRDPILYKQCSAVEATRAVSVQ